MRLFVLALAFALCAFAPEAFGLPSNVSASAGYQHSLALSSDGTLRVWGNDTSGALGLARVLISASPKAITSISGVQSVASGGYHTLALKTSAIVPSVASAGNPG